MTTSQLTVSQYLDLRPTTLADGRDPAAHVFLVRVRTFEDLVALRLLPALDKEAFEAAIRADDEAARQAALDSGHADSSCKCEGSPSPITPGTIRRKHQENLARLLNDAWPYLRAHEAYLAYGAVCGRGTNLIRILAADRIRVGPGQTLEVPAEVDAIHAHSLTVHATGRVILRGRSKKIKVKVMRGEGQDPDHPQFNIVARGRDGEDGKRGVDGSRGQDGHEGQGANCNPWDDDCAKPGGPGTAGSDGGGGGPGGSASHASEVIIEVKRLYDGIAIDASGGDGGRGGDGGTGGAGGSGGRGGPGNDCEEGWDGGAGGNGGRGGRGGMGGDGGNGGRIIWDVRRDYTKFEMPLVVEAGRGGRGGIGGTGGSAGRGGDIGATTGSFSRSSDCNRSGRHGPSGSVGATGEPGESGSSGRQGEVIRPRGAIVAVDDRPDFEGKEPRATMRDILTTDW